MVVIGITGNTGSGKTTVSTIMKNNLNCTVVSADYIAKTINIPGSEYYKETVELLGDVILKEDDTIDRRKLAEIIFTNIEIKEKLNKITAKYVGTEIERIINEERKLNKNNFIIVDAPLLLECEINKICDYTIAVVCKNKETKMRRIMARDRLTRNQAETRLNAQPSIEFYNSQADIIINNDKNTRYDKLIQEVLKVIRKIKAELKNNSMN